MVRGSVHVGFVLPPDKARALTKAVKELALNHGASVVIDRDAPRSTKLPGLDDELNEQLTAASLTTIDLITAQDREALKEHGLDGSQCGDVVRYLAKQDPPRALAGTTAYVYDQLELLDLERGLHERVSAHYSSISALVKAGGVALGLKDRSSVESRLVFQRRLHLGAIPASTPLSTFGFDEEVKSLLFETARISPDTPAGDLAASVLLKLLAQAPNARPGSAKLRVRQIRRALAGYGIELRQHPAHS